MKKTVISGLCCFLIAAAIAAGAMDACAAPTRPAGKDKLQAIQRTLESKHTLKFHDGKFKIVIFSDTHSDVKKAPKYIKAIVDKEKPDLVMITGDIILYKTMETCRSDMDKLFKYLDDKKIPWAQVYGNHDVEYSKTMSIKELKGNVQALYESHPYNVSKAGPKDISGVGNYVLPVYSSDGKKIAMTVWGLDSNMYLENNYPEMPAEVILPKSTNGGYKWDYIKPEQVMWYHNTSSAIEKFAGRKVPGMMFFHIPLPESNYIPNNPKETGMVGERREPVNCSELNSGLFSSILSRRDICAIFNGHDHINDYIGTYVGVRMAYTPCITHNNYHNKNVMGGRVVNISENDPKNFETHIDYLLKLGIYDDSLDREDPKEVPGIKTPETASVPKKLNEPGMLATFDDFKPVIKDDLVAKGAGADIGTYFRSGTDIPEPEFPYAEPTDKGYDGNAVQIIKKQGTDSGKISLYFPEKKYSGEKYLRMWIDFTGIDWNMCGFGLINKEGALFQTSDNKGKDYFALFYLPDGQKKWKAYTLSNQGRIGATQAISLYNFKGWIALRVEDLIDGGGPATNPQKERKGTSLRNGDVLKGFYFWYSLLHDSMIGKPFIIDDVCVTDDYSKFN